MRCTISGNLKCVAGCDTAKADFEFRVRTQGTSERWSIGFVPEDAATKSSGSSSFKLKILKKCTDLINPNPQTQNLAAGLPTHIATQCSSLPPGYGFRISDV